MIATFERYTKFEKACAVKESLENHGVPDEEVRELIALSGKRAFMSEEEFEKEFEELTGIKEKAVEHE